MNLIILAGLMLIIIGKIVFQRQNKAGYAGQETQIGRGFGAAFIIVGIISLFGWLVQAISINLLEVPYLDWEMWTVVPLVFIFIIIINISRRPV